METRTHLNQIRERLDISAAALAKLAGITRQTIYAIEAGDYVPNTTVALQLAKILEVSRRGAVLSRKRNPLRLSPSPSISSPPRAPASRCSSAASATGPSGSPPRRNPDVPRPMQSPSMVPRRRSFRNGETKNAS